LQGPAALRAQALARESGVPVIQDANAAAVLLPFDVGTLVPPEYWELVARVFVAVAAMGGTSA
ncbi:MAG TPA: EscU/YscU/HrcU family type III secretion system export apparatus switch protein, partial [Spirochaetales bacterium]|nr:EscU/YscU/HrcU family type III secretion system export apparatus switch protein [Spirochaetales bacterium]